MGVPPPPRLATARRTARRIRASGVRTQHGLASNARSGPTRWSGWVQKPRERSDRLGTVEFVHLMDQF
jgi:hypothetical protein